MCDGVTLNVTICSWPSWAKENGALAGSDFQPCRHGQMDAALSGTFHIAVNLDAERNRMLIQRDHSGALGHGDGDCRTDGQRMIHVAGAYFMLDGLHYFT